MYSASRRDADPLTFRASRRCFAADPSRASTTPDPRVSIGAPRRGAHVEHVPPVRHKQSDPRQAHHRRYGRLWRQTATLAGAAALASFVLPSGLSSAAPRQPAPDLKTLIAKAHVLSNQINQLDEQYNGLRIQLSQARTQAKVAQRTYAQDIVQ